MVGGPRATHVRGRLGDRLRLRSLTLVSTWLAPAILAAILCTTLALVLARLDLSTSPAGLLSRVNDIARTVASALFVTAGVLRLTRWRVHGDGRSAVMGSALVVLGGLCFPLVTITRLLAHPGEVSALTTLTRALVTAVVIEIVWRVFTDDEPRPSHLIVRRALVVLTGFLFLVGLSMTGATGLLGGFPVHVVVPAALATGWILLGLRATLLADTHAWAGRVAPLLGAMGVAEILRAFDRGVDGTWTLAALALNVSAAIIATVSALRDLNEAADQRSSQTDGLVSALAASERGRQRPAGLA